MSTRITPLSGDPTEQHGPSCDRPHEEPADMAGYELSKTDYLNRLRRIEGQVRGLQRMIDEDVYCIDVLTQVSSVTKALQRVGVGLVDEHLRHCVRDAADDGDEAFDDKMKEATAAIERLLRS